VVVFDRIREKMSENKTEPVQNVFAGAINETLSRTLITAGTTVLSALVLLVLGGTVVKGFVFAIFLGILFGTYSSIFIASAIASDLFGKSSDTQAEEVAPVK
jgi:SecD/SecF fusion protein